MNTSARRFAAGFLAGASSILGLLLLLMLLLIGAGLAGMIRDLSLPQNAGVSFGQALAAQLLSTLAALPGYVWSARWAIVTLGLLGVVLALADASRPRIRRPWRDHLGLVVTVGCAGCAVFWLVFSSRETVAGWLASQPALFSERGLLFDSSWLPLAVGLLSTFALALTMLAAWSWWYQRWAGWLRVPRPPSVEQERELASARASDVYDVRARPQPAPAASAPPAAGTDGPARQRWLLASFAGMLLGGALFMLCAGWFTRVGPAIAGGEYWVDAETPGVSVELLLPQTPRSLMLSNTVGDGSIVVRLAGQDESTLLQEQFGLSGTATNIASKQWDLGGVAPGAYRLELVLEQGDGGQVRYIALFDGGAGAVLAALLASLAAGATLACAVVLALELVVRGSRAS